MDIINGAKPQREGRFVRIIIGWASTGKTGISGPTKTISITGSTVIKIYHKIKKLIKNER